MILSRKTASFSPKKLGVAWTLPSVRAEAQSLFRLVVRNKESVESLRDLIRVAPSELNALATLMAKFPELSRQVEGAIAFRQRVLEEFERLVRRRNAL